MLLACHLLRKDDDEIRVTLVEKREAVGRGMAYSTAQPGHLLNVRASNMSAFADDPSHFQRWLTTHDAASQGREPGPLTFAQRRVYGRYIAELITPHLGAPGAPGRLQVVYGEGRSISIAPSGVRVLIDDGRCFAGDVAVLATGHDEAPRGGPSCYVNPWESPAASGIDRDAAVLIRGTGLTMVDFVVSLRAAGHRGPIHAMSRRGLLPQAHRAVTALALDAKDIPFGASLVTLWRFVRRLAKETMAKGGDWRSVVDGIRPYTWELWRRLPFDSKQRFLRHARAYWEVHRHRMAPEVAEEIGEALAAGQLNIITAKTLQLVPTANRRAHRLPAARQDRVGDVGGGQGRRMHRRLYGPAGDHQPGAPAAVRPRPRTARSARDRHRRRRRLRYRRYQRPCVARFVRRRAADTGGILGDHGGA